MQYLSLSQLNGFAQMEEWVDELIVSIIDEFKNVNYTYTDKNGKEFVVFKMLEYENYSIDERFIDTKRKQFIVTINMYFDCCTSQTFVIPFKAFESEDEKKKYVRLTINEWKEKSKPKFDNYVERQENLKKKQEEDDYKKFLELQEKFGNKKE